MADLTAYDVKHNLGNGENNRDGTDNNRSFNHGVEGPTTDEAILLQRHKAIRNLMGTLLLSAGVPMITAGDEYGRSQRGNNNAYCHDSELTWMGWLRTREQRELFATTKRLLELRRTNPALRPSEFAVFGQTTKNASHMDWFDATGALMDDEDWNSPENRTLQYLAASTPDQEEFNRILLIVHGVEDDVKVVTPRRARRRRRTSCSGTARPRCRSRRTRPSSLPAPDGSSAARRCSCTGRTDPVWRPFAGAGQHPTERRTRRARRSAGRRPAGRT